MDEFQKRLRCVSAALLQLCQEFERLEYSYSDVLNQNYPFDVCLLEVAHNFMEWQETINSLVEAVKSEEKANC